MNKFNDNSFNIDVIEEKDFNDVIAFCDKSKTYSSMYSIMCHNVKRDIYNSSYVSIALFYDSGKGTAKIVGIAVMKIDFEYADVNLIEMIIEPKLATMGIGSYFCTRLMNFLNEEYAIGYMPFPYIPYDEYCYSILQDNVVKSRHQQRIENKNGISKRKKKPQKQKNIAQVTSMKKDVAEAKIVGTTPVEHKTSVVTENGKDKINPTSKLRRKTSSAAQADNVTGKMSVAGHNEVVASKENEISKNKASSLRPKLQDEKYNQPATSVTTENTNKTSAEKKYSTKLRSISKQSSNEIKISDSVKEEPQPTYLPSSNKNNEIEQQKPAKKTGLTPQLKKEKFEESTKAQHIDKNSVPNELRTKETKDCSPNKNNAFEYNVENFHIDHEEELNLREDVANNNKTIEFLRKKSRKKNQQEENKTVQEPSSLSVSEIKTDTIAESEPTENKAKKRNPILIAIVAIVAVTAVVCCVLFLLLPNIRNQGPSAQQPAQETNIASTVTLTITAEDSVDDVCTKMKQIGLSSQADALTKLMEMSGRNTANGNSVFVSGDYVISSEETVEDIYKRISTGEYDKQLSINITPNMNLADVTGAVEISTDHMISASSLEAALISTAKSNEMTNGLTITDGEIPLYIFAQSYNYASGESPEDLATKMLKPCSLQFKNSKKTAEEFNNYLKKASTLSQIAKYDEDKEMLSAIYDKGLLHSEDKENQYKTITPFDLTAAMNPSKTQVSEYSKDAGGKITFS